MADERIVYDALFVRILYRVASLAFPMARRRTQKALSSPQAVTANWKEEACRRTQGQPPIPQILAAKAKPQVAQVVGVSVLRIEN